MSSETIFPVNTTATFCFIMSIGSRMNVHPAPVTMLLFIVSTQVSQPAAKARKSKVKAARYVTSVSSLSKRHCRGGFHKELGLVLSRVRTSYSS